jgi:hypothetical protein
VAAKRKKEGRAKSKRKLPTGQHTPGCLLPTKPTDEALRNVMVGRLPHRERAIVEYFEGQSNKGGGPPIRVRHLERLLCETVTGTEYELWDVHATDGRWWVVSPMTNLYPQDAFPSADYMLSFHIGLIARITHRSQRSASGPTPRLAGAYRRWEQAARALDAVKESEDLQAVGVKCRQCLLTLIREAQKGVELPPDAARPKGADFPAWADLIANWALPGSSAEDLRAYVKSSAKTTWQLANWLTHTPNARHIDAELTVEAVRHLLDAYVAAIVRRESKQPDRCPKCSSYQMHSVYTPELERDPPYVLMCEACGWNDEDAPTQPSLLPTQ